MTRPVRLLYRHFLVDGWTIHRAYGEVIWVLRYGTESTLDPECDYDNLVKRYAL
jgi:hypothetical protein